MANAGQLVVHLHVRCWVPYYLSAVQLFCQTFGTQPNVERVAAFIIRRGIKVSV